jgi:bacterioferritin
MDKNKLLFKLKEFYVLEVYQLDLYTSQAESVQETHLKRSFERKAQIEKEHVDYFAEKITELGGNVSTIAKSTFSAAGFVSGKVSGIMGLDDRFKLGKAVENEAVNMYHTFIKEATEDPELKELTKQLWYNMIDEEQHQYWFEKHLSRLPSDS